MKIKGSGKNGNWKLEIWLNNEHDITNTIVQLCWETFLLNKAQKQQLHVWRSDLSILVWFVQCSWSNYLLSLQQFFFCHHIAFQLRFIWMTLKSFHSNVENWNMTDSYRGLKHHFPQCFCTSSIHLTPTYLELWNKSADFLLPVVQCGSWSNHKKWTPNIMCLSI